MKIPVPPDMKIFLTGATGFLARHIGVTLAAAGHQLLALRRKNPGFTSEKLGN